MQQKFCKEYRKACKAATDTKFMPRIQCVRLNIRPWVLIRINVDVQYQRNAGEGPSVAVSLHCDALACSHDRSAPVQSVKRTPNLKGPGSWNGLLNTWGKVETFFFRLTRAMISSSYQTPLQRVILIQIVINTHNLQKLKWPKRLMRERRSVRATS